MCLEVDRCCFCVDLSSSSHAIALVEATLSVPFLVHGVAATSVAHLFVGLVLFVSAWLVMALLDDVTQPCDYLCRVLFDGAFLRRRVLLSAWLASTVLKSLSLLSAGVVCAFIVAEMASPAADGADRSSPVLDSIGAIGDSYLSCCVFDFNSKWRDF